MTNPNQTDSFFFTKYNQTDNPAVKSVQTMSLSLNKRVSNRRVELDDMYNNYNLFKYSKVFMPKRRSSMRQGIQTERQSNFHNYKAIKRESDKLKQRLNLMQNQRKILFEKLRSQK